ncbi:MAG: aminotransferase class I/II-fold pyridoxal phosphate-dependent enzyme [Candidatus Aminicenantes bacterium]|jgi:aspartate/methionine/tyrosine aminotransferase
MKIDEFVMERWQSNWEHVVNYNISESGVKALTPEELLSPEEFEKLSKTKLGYIQTNGTKQLKETICALYDEASPENILVTSGSAEANFLLMWHFIEPGDEVVFMLPNFMQIHGLMKYFGANVKTFFLKEELDWNPDLDELKSVVTKDTKLIAVTNPNNPTGGQLSEESRESILELSRWADAWLVSDEVYQGAEYDGIITPSFWGSYKKAIVTNGLSKAYGLPGLRVGWMVAPEHITNTLWSYKDYTTITISAISDKLAQTALSPVKRDFILERTRQIIRSNFSILEGWMDKQEGLFQCTPPRAGAIAFPRYNLDINATELAHRIRKEKSVLIQPGDQFEVDYHIRFGLGEDAEFFVEALDLIGEVLDGLKA